jgi:hypothetical protein
MTNASSDRRSIAYEFKAINRSADLFPPEKELKAPALIKKWCQVSYEYPGRGEATEGIVRYRHTSNTGPWLWGDLRGGRRGPEGPLCSSCSTQKQCIVRHEKASCPDFADVAVLGPIEWHVDVQPNAARIIGPQVARKSKKKAVTFPCKFPDGCDHALARRAFRGKGGAGRANDHMRSHHANWPGLEGALYPVPVEAAVEGMPLHSGHTAALTVRCSFTAPSAPRWSHRERRRARWAG